jgi:hypothetical protein
MDTLSPRDKKEKKKSLKISLKMSTNAFLTQCFGCHDGVESGKEEFEISFYS